MSADKSQSPTLGAQLDEKDIGGNSSKASTLDAVPSTDRGEDHSNDLLGQQDLDPVLSRKMNLVNNVRQDSKTESLAPRTQLTRSQVIDEIGWTPYHTKLFFLNGFG
jgi:hypothetical protein